MHTIEVIWSEDSEDKARIQDFFFRYGLTPTKEFESGSPGAYMLREAGGTEYDLRVLTWPYPLVFIKNAAGKVVWCDYNPGSGSLLFAYQIMLGERVTA